MADFCIGPRDPLPDTRFGWLDNGELKTPSTRDLFWRKRAILVGIPGAFTPVCSRIHIPQFVERAPSLLKSGFDVIAIVARNDPWSLAAWAEELDPERRLLYLSDGNLTFGRKTKLAVTVPEYFLGECLQRFVMVTNDLIVEKISIERSLGEVTCTAAQNLDVAAA